MNFFNRNKAVLPTLENYGEKVVARAKTLVAAIDGAVFTNRSAAKKLTSISYLLGLNSSAKIEKSKKIGNMNTGILYLAPAMTSGINTCPTATQGCSDACLFNSGRGGMKAAGTLISNVNAARLMKTILFYANRTFFMDWICAEIDAYNAKSEKAGIEFCVRLNGTSDININLFKVGNECIVEKYSNIQFYDYTKQLSQLKNAEKYSNYDVVYSFANTEEKNNIANTLYAAANGFRIAAVFDISTFPNKEFPTTFLGLPIVNGDESDLIFTRKANSILALNYKRAAGHDKKGNNFIMTFEEYTRVNKLLS